MAVGGGVTEAAIAPWWTERMVHETKAFTRQDVPTASSAEERADPIWQRAAVLSMVAARHGIALPPGAFLAASASAESPEGFIEKVAGRYRTDDGRSVDLTFRVRALAGEDWAALCRALDEGKPWIVSSAKEIKIGYKTAWWWSPNDTRSPADASPTVYWVYTYQPSPAYVAGVTVLQFEIGQKPKAKIDAVWEVVLKPATD